MALGSSRPARSALVKLLHRLNLIDEAAASRTDVLQTASPVAFYAAEGFFDEADAIKIISQRLNVRPIVFSKDSMTTLATGLTDQILEKIPLIHWREMRAAPVGEEKGALVVAFANPLDHENRSTIEFSLGKPVIVAMAEESQILSLLNKRESLAHDRALTNLLERSEGEEPGTESGESSEEAGETAAIDAAPVVRLVNKIFLDSIELGASDIHISPERKQLRVKARVDGILRDTLTVPPSLSSSVISRIKLLAGMDIAERRKPQDGRTRVPAGDGYRDIRISTIPTVYGESLVARILSTQVTHTSFDDLGMPPELVERFRNSLRGSSRVILVTGPTGSGKTSTLYAAIRYLHDGKTNIITVEDPIEYRLEGLSQIQVNPKVGLTFASGLRSILRQDPDVVVIGEIRDPETADIAMQVAQTGHLVLSTLHTNSSAAAVTRLLDLGIPGYLIASSVDSILAQRLVRRLCSCSQPAPASDMHRLGSGMEPLANARVAGSCTRCSGTGYIGRVGVYSLLSVDDTMRDVIRGGASERQLEEAGQGSGFRTLFEAGLRLVNDGVTSLDEFERTIGPVKIMTPASPDRTQTASAAVAPRAPEQLRKQCVLLVEDDDNMRTVLTMILERAMFEVIQACNGQEGLEKVFARMPDLVLCDLMMPIMDGAEMVEALRQNPSLRTLPILMLTAADSEENELRILKSGADDFVSKTADQKILLARVKRLLERSVAER